MAFCSAICCLTRSFDADVALAATLVVLRICTPQHPPYPLLSLQVAGCCTMCSCELGT